MTDDQNLPITTLDNFGDAMEGSLAVGLARAEIDTQIATARRWPRILTKVSQQIMTLATLDEETAEESMYALPRGGKPIQGPSIRFAEIVKTSYGNCRAAARVVHVDRVEKVVIAEGVFHDLETNTATRAEVRRRIVTSRGTLYNDDMIIVTGNAACSIALRNAILGGVPKGLWRKAFEAVQRTIAGDVATLSVTRDKAIKALANFGVKPEQVFTALGVGGEEDISIVHIPTLRGMFATLKNGEATVEEMFKGTVVSGGAHEKVAHPLRDDPPPPKDAGGQTVEHDAKTGETTDSARASEDRRAEEDGPFDVEQDMNDPPAERGALQQQTDPKQDRITSGPQARQDAPAPGTVAKDAGPAKTTEKPVSAKPSGPRTQWDDGEDYIGWFDDVLDRAKTPGAIKDEWARTRTERRQLLSDDQLDAVTRKKDDAVNKLKAAG